MAPRVVFKILRKGLPERYCGAGFPALSGTADSSPAARRQPAIAGRDDYFFSSLDSPQELTSIFADLVYNTGLTLEEATWSGGLLPSTDPASVATFRSLIYLDPAHNFTGSGSLDLSMRVRLEAGRSAAVPEPAAILLAFLGLALLPRRRRK